MLNAKAMDKLKRTQALINGESRLGPPARHDLAVSLEILARWQDLRIGRCKPCNRGYGWDVKTSGTIAVVKCPECQAKLGKTTFLFDGEFSVIS